MSDIPRIAVICTHNRPVELARLLDSLATQCHAVFVVDNASTPPVNLPRKHWGPGGPDAEHVGMRQIVIRDEEQPPNLARLWNIGLDAAAEYVRGGDYIGHDVGVFNDDADVPAGWWDIVSGALRAHPTAVVCCTPAYAPIAAPVLKTKPDNDLWGRMTPWAFVARGELGLRGDERLRWWYGDTMLDWDARKAGGVLTVPGPIVVNTGANSSTVGVLAEQAGRDRQTFKEINGWLPW